MKFILATATAAAAFLTAVLAGPHGHLEETRVEAGGLCDASVTQHSGYYKVNSPGSTDKNYVS